MTTEATTLSETLHLESYLELPLRASYKLGSITYKHLSILATRHGPPSMVLKQGDGLDLPHVSKGVLQVVAATAGEVVAPSDL